MLNKSVCQKCYLYRETIWTSKNDEAWDKKRAINCPSQSIEFSQDGNVIPKGTGIHNFLADIFCNSVSVLDDDPPPWCNFFDDHIKRN